ncbi:MAG: hypothetical protein QW103_02775 [Candidatus Pacearchaeota archaeon]
MSSEIVEIKELEELPENLWIHMFVSQAINNINNKEHFIEIVKTFEYVSLESGWVDKEAYLEKIQNDEELKNEINKKTTSVEESIKKEYEIARIKFSFLLGSIIKKMPTEVILSV